MERTRRHRRWLQPRRPLADADGWITPHPERHRIPVEIRGTPRRLARGNNGEPAGGVGDDGEVVVGLGDAGQPIGGVDDNGEAPGDVGQPVDGVGNAGQLAGIVGDAGERSGRWNYGRPFSNATPTAMISRSGGQTGGVADSEGFLTSDSSGSPILSTTELMTGFIVSEVDKTLWNECYADAYER